MDLTDEFNRQKIKIEIKLCQVCKKKMENILVVVDALFAKNILILKIL